MGTLESIGTPRRLAELPACVAGLRGAVWRPVGGAPEPVSIDEAARRMRSGPPPLVAHGPSTARRLGIKGIHAFDVLELFAFARPASFCVPTPRGLALALGLPAPATVEDEAIVLADCAGRLLQSLGATGVSGDPQAAAVAEAMAVGGWPWAPMVLEALGPEAEHGRAAGLDVWRRLPEWAERGPEPPAGTQAVDPGEARHRLAQLLGSGAEARPQQADYASAVTAAFLPRDKEGVPHVVLADAGTGVGKTLGYVAPASVWSEKNAGAVWISTFTRNLQHQIDQELDRLYPDPGAKARKAVIRKGRENYLCLLNFEEYVGAARLGGSDAVAAGLIARWAAHTKDGALVGGDFSGWLADLVGRGRAAGLADQRGECIYSACTHYHKCFIERSIRRARRAEIVVANHALVMIQAALGGGDDRALPTRYVFDEGHHVFGAADSAFSGHLTGQEAADLRRWIRGADGRSGRRSRARGLETRLGELALGDEEALEAIAAAQRASRALPGDGWMARLAGPAPEGEAERFLQLVRQQVYARAQSTQGAYGIEVDARPPVDGLTDGALALDAALADLAKPLVVLAARLAARLDDEADDLDTPTRLRIEAMVRGLARRSEVQIVAWRSMLRTLIEDVVPPEFVDWFSVDREFGRDVDVGMHRHWIDPTVPFVEAVAPHAHGMVMTSATLRDGTGDEEADWAAAEAMTGGRHLTEPPTRAAVPSPFDYAGQTQVIVVTDVRRDDPDQVAAAYRALVLAARGGTLGLFTAISRLTAVHKRMAGPLEEAGLPLYAQHVDGLDVSTLIDIFRAERDATLLGTDAVRDGVDVPGDSLRLIIFDRVPWPRPTILHRARRDAFGGRAYDDMLVRLRLKQAYGRLIRRGDDRGVFVLLDGRMPSRLASAFPEGVEIARLGLADAVRRTGTFLGASATEASPS